MLNMRATANRRRSYSESCLPGFLPLCERPLLSKRQDACEMAFRCSSQLAQHRFNDSRAALERKKESIALALELKPETLSRLGDAKMLISTLQSSYIELMLQIDELNLRNLVLAKENEAQRKEQRQQAALFANILRRPSQEQATFTGTEIELQRLLTLKRSEIQNYRLTVSELETRIANLKEENLALEDTAKNRHEVTRFVESQLQSLQSDIVELKNCAKERDFRLDEARYNNIQLRARVDEFSTVEKKAKTEISALQKQLNNSQEESSQLRSRIEHLENACQKTANAYKKLLASMAQEKDLSTALNNELEENHKTSQNIQGALASMKRTLELTRAAKTSAEERVKSLELVLSKKENDLSNLIIKSEETKARNEATLSKKDQEIWLLSQKLKAATDAAASAANPVDAAALGHAPTTLVDQKIVAQMEEKMEDMKKSYEKELDMTLLKIKALELNTNDLKENICELEKLLFEPRMKILKEIEEEIGIIIDDYLVNESSMETVLLCPKCLDVYSRPSTLIPCGHTYCRQCIDQMREENYGRLYCVDCQENGGKAVYETPKDCFFNDILETVAKKFQHRKSIGEKIVEWTKKVSLAQTTA